MSKKLQTITIPENSSFGIKGVPNKDEKKFVDWEIAGKELYQIIKETNPLMYESIKEEVLKDVFFKNYTIEQLEKMKEINEEGLGGFYYHICFNRVLGEIISSLK